MSSKPKHSFLRTVRFKLLVTYTLVFAALASAGFLAAYFAIRSHLYREIDRNLEVRSRRMETRYALGEGVDNDEQMILPAQIPKVVLDAVKQRIPGLTVVQAKTENKRNGTAYEVIGVSSDHSYEIEVGVDGDIKELERRSLHRNQQHLAAEFAVDAENEGAGRVAHLLLSPTKEVLAASDLEAWDGILAPVEPGTTQTISLAGRNEPVRLQCRRIFDGNLLCTAVSLAEPEALLRQCRLIFFCTVAAMCILGGLAGGLVARRAMAGVQRVTDTAAEIAAGNLAARVPVGSEGAEIEELAKTFNEMQTRLHELVSELKEISNNIAHDLRTPLTRIRAAAETTVTGSESVDSYREMAGEVVEECDRLIEMINTMLEIAQAEAGTAALKLETVDLSATVERAVELMQPVAEEKGIALSVRRNGAITVSGDRVRLQRVIANLLDNSIKYTETGGNVNLSANAVNGNVTLCVEDNGAGIPAAELEHVFDRFYRGDASRSRPGNGLGLSLVRAIVNAHDGTIEITSSPEDGTRVEVTLPTNIADR